MKRCGVLWAVWRMGSLPSCSRAEWEPKSPGQKRQLSPGPVLGLALLSNRLGGWEALPVHQGLSPLRSPTR